METTFNPCNESYTRFIKHSSPEISKELLCDHQRVPAVVLLFHPHFNIWISCGEKRFLLLSLNVGSSHVSSHMHKLLHTSPFICGVMCLSGEKQACFLFQLKDLKALSLRIDGLHEHAIPHQSSKQFLLFFHKIFLSVCICICVLPAGLVQIPLHWSEFRNIWIRIWQTVIRAVCFQLVSSVSWMWFSCTHTALMKQI